MESRRAVLRVSAIVFVASAAMTIAMSASMSAMGAMEMPGGWTMSMMWMRMPDQTWLGATASFVGMWVVMMVAMMLPSLTPALLCHHESLGRGGVADAGWLTAIVSVGYFMVWALLGAIMFPLGVVLAEIAMRDASLARLGPMVAGAIILMAGALQQTQWKARRLALCREEGGRHRTPAGHATAALRHGLRLGVSCSLSCVSLTVITLALGVMDLRAMAVVAVAITSERLAANGARAARIVGVVAVAFGMLVIARAASAS